ncbi:MAG: alpha/beta hydrolase-fold protein, partial [Halapricum sp.]
STETTETKASTETTESKPTTETNGSDTTASQTHVVGNVTTMTIDMPQFDDRSRTIRVYTPPGYETSDRSYPVVYMQDGQNLFDNRTAFKEEWRVDETMERLADSGELSAIVVGIDNGGAQRDDEYIPWPFENGNMGGEGDQYAAFLAETLKPRIDERYRTEPNETAIVGSSFGGAISIYTAFEYPNTFQYVGSMSTSAPVEPLFQYMNGTEQGPDRVYLDWGTEETDRPERFVSLQREFAQLVEDRGYERGETLLTVEDEGGVHRETAWRDRFPRAVQWLLKGVDPAS